jgi:predicted CopG family antitoxin
MRTTISIPDEIYSEAKEIMGSRPFSDFASEAIQTRVEELKRQRLAAEMEEGYRAEAENPSLDADWANVETEGL